MSATAAGAASLGAAAVDKPWRRQAAVVCACGSKADVATLGNLCVDIVLDVPCLPPSNPAAKLKFLRHLESCPPDESAWEAGGICNFTIAAARLGLECVSIGHIGSEPFGKFLSRILDKEGVDVARISADVTSDFDGSTLVCWVLVDPEHQHAFCSRFDFNKAPVLDKMHKLPPKAESVIQNSKALHFNGFAFDELLPSAILSAVDCAHAAGNAVFFDPGPRGESLFRQDRSTLERILTLSDVLLLTADEAATLTGIDDPYAAATALLDNGMHTKWVIVKMGAQGSLMADRQGCHHVPGFKVDVIDTVGCGDSFAAAAVLGYNCGLPATTTLTLANAVGGATAMGVGAGRNVATVSKVHRVLSGSDFDGDNNSLANLLLRKDTASFLDKLVTCSCKLTK
ncbi:probable fructokinase-4 isoform X1 [Selaginella moellendorffii]|uniref:probable fructokinase-4 isoform X1 n=1 Tax=Selaginella moellendorffii TaxID=88036 RepID=UPI000D1C6157|nr:probable fructokinase-4 isoform X1 [Selaginella moellendorffii]|eukprot:XP_002969304.2 probable fructokinase-4 isoform X1 [Selaginella moellendorffii]